MDANAARNPVVNQYLCHGGITSFGCSYVKYSDKRINNYDHMASTDRAVTSKGDSGAPWWSGRTIYGVHQGIHDRFGANGSAFTPVGTMTRYLGLKVALD